MASPRFTPSVDSYTPRERALLTLQYLKKVTEKLEDYFETTEMDEQPPVWITEKLNQSASSLGAALSFTSYKADKKVGQTAKPVKFNKDTKEGKS